MTIKWTNKAEKSFDQIITYLTNEWSQKSAFKFIDSVNQFIEILKKHPEIGKPERIKKDLRSFVLSRHVIIFYRIKNDNLIVLLNFFNSRQDPGKKLI